MESIVESQSVLVTYPGVHSAYQAALALWEANALQCFLCSVHEQGRWGRKWSTFLGHGLMEGRAVPGVPSALLSEFPWPLVAKRALDRLWPRGRNRWLAANAAFDRWSARQIATRKPRVVFGTSTADLHSLKAGRRVGARLVHEVPHLHPQVQEELFREAADRAGLPCPAPRLPWRHQMERRREEEVERADLVLTYSGFHRQTYVDGGTDPSRLAVTELWVDPLWRRHGGYMRDRDAPLRALFVGSIGLRKGVPFLLKAAALCGRAVALTIVGPLDGEARKLLSDGPATITVHPPQPHQQLLATYLAHDVFVLPSVADAFGNVALQAMSCGLPLILSSNCGAPTPSPDWVVPAMDPVAIARRLIYYAERRERVEEDGRVASAFAAAYTPERYRAAFRQVIEGCASGLAGPDGASVA